jgi:hypothetical protein
MFVELQTNSAPLRRKSLKHETHWPALLQELEAKFTGLRYGKIH